MADIVPAPDIPRLAILGSDDQFPVNRVFCVGRNYAEHAAEMGASVDRDAPFFFFKGHHAITLSDTAIPYPPGTTDYHHELELVVALASGGADITEDAANACIFGYALGLDMTRRDLQQAYRKKGLPWDTGKNVEGSCILTPLTRASSFAVSDQDITLIKNGNVVQTGRLSDMIWSVSELICHISRLYTLRPGDLIMTGTPAGVGPVVPGDTLLGRVAGLPDLRVTVA